MNTRISKIARLPKNIREELNRRLENGELGRPILDWVNNLPDTQKILAQHFAGKPITHQNLSEWRRTGYQDWLLQQQRLDWYANLAEQDEDIIQQNRSADSFEAMGTLILFELGQSMTAMQHIKNPEARWTRLQNLTREFARLQNAYNRSRRVMLEWDQYNGNRFSGRKDLPPRENTPPKNYNQPPAPQAIKSEPQIAVTSVPRETLPQPVTATLHVSQNPTAPATTPANAAITNVPPPHSAPSNSHATNALQPIPTPSTTPEPPRPSNFELRTPNSEPPSTTPEPPRPYNPPLPQIQHQPPPPPAPKPYRPFSNPIRGRRFVCIEG